MFRPKSDLSQSEFAKEIYFTWAKFYEFNENFGMAAKLYRLAAEQGCSEALAKLECIYQINEAGKFNYGMFHENVHEYLIAVEIYTELVAVGYIEAVIRLKELPQHIEKRYKLNGENYFKLGQMYEDCDELEANTNYAARFYRLSAEQDYRDAFDKLGSLPCSNREKFKLGLFYENRNAYLMAVKIYKELIEDFDRYNKKARIRLTELPRHIEERCQLNEKDYFKLGRIYEDCGGVAANMDYAARFYRLAAEQDCQDALNRLGEASAFNEEKFNLGQFYENKHQYLRSVKIYKELIEDGLGYDKAEIRLTELPQHIEEQCKLNGADYFGLGQMYENCNVAANMDYAARFYRLAAEQDYQDALNRLSDVSAFNEEKFNLGQFCENKHEYLRSVKIYKELIEDGLGYDKAEIRLIELPQHIEEQCKLNGEGYFELGQMYENCKVAANMDYAARFYRLAAEQGCLKALAKLKCISQVNKAVKFNYGVFHENIHEYLIAVEIYIELVAADYIEATIRLIELPQHIEERCKFKLNEKDYFELGQMYENCNGIAGNIDYAARFYNLSAELGNKAALENIKKLVSVGNAEAEFCLSLIYKNAKNVAQNKKESERLCYLAAKKGHEQALAALLKEASNIEQLEQAIMLCQSGVKSKYVGAYFLLGKLYEQGCGVYCNERKAIELYSLAAKERHTKALDSWERLAEHSAEAAFKLAIFYEENVDFGQSLSKASKWYKLAVGQGYFSAIPRLRNIASSGQIDAQLDLASCLEKDIDINSKEIIELYNAAAKKGNHLAIEKLKQFSSSGQAQFYLALIYEKCRDKANALNSCRLAVELGHSAALKKLIDFGKEGDPAEQFYIGLLFENSTQGHRPDYQEAMRWYCQAAKQGYKKALHKLEDWVAHIPEYRKMLWHAISFEGDNIQFNSLQVKFNLAELYEKKSSVDNEHVQIYKLIAE